MALMLSCQKATELIEKKGFAGLSPVESLKLFFHKSMCSACAAYEKQSRLMDRLFRENASETGQGKQNVIENEKLKHQIISKIEQK
jgi:hypothetical protein